MFFYTSTRNLKLRLMIILMLRCINMFWSYVINFLGVSTQRFMPVHMLLYRYIASK